MAHIASHIAFNFSWEEVDLLDTFQRANEGDLGESSDEFSS
jgi:hypothetical protein